MRNIQISKEAKQVIFEHARRAYPDECCGFLYGEDGREARISVALEAPNSKEGDKRRRFEISGKDYMKAEKYALEYQTTLLGIYHSHPEHPAIPSEHDLKQALPFFSYIIVSVKAGEVADITSWQLNDRGEFEQEALQ